MTEFDPTLITEKENDQIGGPMMLGLYIRQLRRQKNLSIGNLAEISGVDKSIISRIESGQTRSLHADNLAAIAHAFEEDPEFLRSLAYRLPPPDAVLKMRKQPISSSMPSPIAETVVTFGEESNRFPKGLLAVYTDREALRRDWPLARVINLAVPGSEILVAGRTLKAWATLDEGYISAIMGKDLKLRFLISSEAACKFLLPDQQTEVEDDWPEALNGFRYLVDNYPTHFEYCISEQLILDGHTCVEKILLPGSEAIDKEAGRLIVQQDINAAAGDAKGTCIWVCTCNDSGAHNSNENLCMAHGLYKRTDQIFKTAKK